MLSSLKDKLLKTVPIFNATQDKQQQNNVNNNKINLNVGAEILSNFLQQWEIIHSFNEENAKNADNVARQIEAISQRIEADKQDISLITHIINNSNLVQNISNCTKQLSNLYDVFSELEEKLVELEDVIEQVEHENRKKEHKYHLVQYKIRKDESLLNLEASLKENYNQELMAFEENRKKMLEERQQVFQEAFKSDMEVFKSLGTLPKVSLPKKQSSALLEEIQIDYDESELDQFFEDK